MADNQDAVSGALGGLDETTDWLQIRGSNRDFELHIWGTFNGTVSIEMRRPGQDAADAIRLGDTFTSEAIRQGGVGGNWDVRAIMSAYSSGTANVSLSVARR